MLFRHTKNGRLSLFNSLIDVDGNSEIGEKVFRCDSVHLAGAVSLRLEEGYDYKSPANPDISDCEVKLRNITILTPDNSTNGKCLHLVNCDRFDISGCVLVSSSRSTDLAPYPAR